ncbi:hypothetical protein JM83_3708 [Gillisia sp. Hel_I_86]|nr:hypothetical protein JM83_3708 [Gillisia sp. Hel_I_86]
MLLGDQDINILEESFEEIFMNDIHILIVVIKTKLAPLNFILGHLSSVSL